jgi:hypothetical protein
MAVPTRVSGLVVDVRQGEAITLGHNIRIQFMEKSGRVTRVKIVAPLDVKIKKDSGKGEECQYATQGQAL